MTEIASFHADDPDALVAASLSCPRCLHAAGRVELEGDTNDARARCCCSACGNERTVDLLPEQFLRLALMSVTAR